MIVSVDDLKKAFTINEIKSTLTDEQLADLIKIETDSILAQLGVSLEPEVHNFTFYSERPPFQVVLPIKYALGIEKVFVNGHFIHQDEYSFDEKNSIVYIHPHHRFMHSLPLNHFKSFKIDITYVTVIPEYIKNKLKPLILDVILYKEAPDSKKGLVSIKEGDTTVTYDKNTTITYLSGQRINEQIKGLKRMLYPSTTMMI